MVNYWKSKVLPTIKKVFENPKKAAGIEACKVFDESKEQYSTEFEEKKTELQPKVLEIYEACTPEIKTLIKAPKESGLKKSSAAVKKFLDELAKIEFPGSKALCEACTKVGPGYLTGPVTFVFGKIATFLPEEKVEEKVEEPAPVVEEKKTEEKIEEACAPETKEKEIVVEPVAEPSTSAEKIEEPAPVVAPVVACEPAKVEEAPPAPVPVPAPAPAPAPAPVAEPAKC